MASVSELIRFILTVVLKFGKLQSDESGPFHLQKDCFICSLLRFSPTLIDRCSAVLELLYLNVAFDQ